MQKLVKKEYQIPFILVTSLFFLWGFAHAILDVLNKQSVLCLRGTKIGKMTIRCSYHDIAFTKKNNR